MSVAVNSYTKSENRFYLHEVGIIETDSTIMPGKAKSQYTGAESVIDKVTQNRDIDKQKFSMETPVEQTDKLIAVHNLNASKLKKDIALGGFPVPSIAVTRADLLER